MYKKYRKILLVLLLLTTSDLLRVGVITHNDGFIPWFFLAIVILPICGLAVALWLKILSFSLKEWQRVILLTIITLVWFIFSWEIFGIGVSKLWPSDYFCILGLYTWFVYTGFFVGKAYLRELAQRRLGWRTVTILCTITVIGILWGDRFDFWRYLGNFIPCLKLYIKSGPLV